MSFIKTMLEKQAIEELERRVKDGEFDFLYLFTTSESRLDCGSGNWFFQVWGDIGGIEIPISAKTGTLNACYCNECKSLGQNLTELYSIFFGLNWIFEQFPQTDIWFWVSNSQLVLDYTDKVINFAGKEITCLNLQVFLTDLHDLLCYIRPDFEVYGYENKEIIPSVNFNQIPYTSDWEFGEKK